MYEEFSACCKRCSNLSFNQWEPDWYIWPITGLEIVIEHLYLLARCTSTQGGRPKIEILWLFNIHFCFSKIRVVYGSVSTKKWKNLYVDIAGRQAFPCFLFQAVFLVTNFILSKFNPLWLKEFRSYLVFLAC